MLPELSSSECREPVDLIGRSSTSSGSAVIAQPVLLGQTSTAPARALSPENLKRLVEDLTERVECVFEKAIAEQINSMAGLRAELEYVQKEYDLDSGKVAAPAMQEKWHRRREDDHVRIEQVQTSSRAILEVFASRIAALQNAINIQLLETAILDAVMKGKFGSWSALVYTPTYGASQVLHEAGIALDERMKTLGIKPTEKITQELLEVVRKQPKAEPSDLIKSMMDLTSKLIGLKEKTKTIHAALSSKAEVAKTTDWPKRIYFSLSKMLTIYQTTMGHIKKELLSLVITPEKNELNVRWETITSIEAAIKSSLEDLKNCFKLTTDDQVVFEFSSPSDVYEEAFDILDEISELREKFILKNKIVSEETPEQKQVSYLQDKRHYERLKSSKMHFEERDKLPTRRQQITQAMETYKSYIAVMERGRSACELHLKEVERLATERTAWKV